MKKVLLFLILLILPIGAKGYYCDYEDYNIAQKKASNVSSFVDYEMVNDEAIFTITIYNIKEFQTIKDVKNNKSYTYNGKEYIKINVTNPGTYTFEVYSSENYCDDNYLNKIFVEIPTYNKYYKDELCSGIESYKYCQKWFSTKISYDQFKKAVLDYKKSINEDNKSNTDDYKSIYEYILEFYLNYWFIILPTIIVLGIVGIILKKKQENKFNL